jgi:hypothetical protein
LRLRAQKQNDSSSSALERTEALWGIIPLSLSRSLAVSRARSARSRAIIYRSQPRSLDGRNQFKQEDLSFRITPEAEQTILW